MKRVPVYKETCYACDSLSTGAIADPKSRQTEVSGYLPACARHADPKLKSYAACIYCSTQVRASSPTLDGDYAHKKCHKEACR